MKYVTLLALAACNFQAPSGTPGGDDVQPTIVTVGFGAESSDADEKASALSINVALSEASDTPVTVSYAVVGGTAVPADYTFTPGTLTFAPGETMAAIPIGIVDDMMEEDVETIELALSSPNGAELGTETHTITIANDVLPRVSFTAAGLDVNEGASGMVALALDKASDVDVGIEVAISTGGTTAETGDYQFQNNIVVTFPAGTTTATVPITAATDAVDEDDEIVALALVNPTAGVVPGATVAHEVKLLDQNAPPTVAFVDADSDDPESNAQINFVVRLSVASERVVTVPYELLAGANNPATPTTDFALEASPLVFQPGDTEESITFTGVEDDDVEANEELRVRLIAPPDGTATLGGNAERRHTIEDDDAVSIRWNQQSAQVQEFDSGSRTYDMAVRLSRPVGRTVTVQVAVDPNGTTATNGSDFTFTPVTLTFQPGDTSEDINVTVHGDNGNENTERILLLLSNPTGGATLENPPRRSLDIVDDDGP